MTYHNPTGEKNVYDRFGYGLQIICNNTQGKVSGSTDADTINADKKVKNQQR